MGNPISHILEEQFRGQIKVGFNLIDLCEDYNNEGTLGEFDIPTFGANLAEFNIPTFWATLAEK